MPRLGLNQDLSEVVADLGDLASLAWSPPRLGTVPPQERNVTMWTTETPERVEPKCHMILWCLNQEGLEVI